MSIIIKCTFCIGNYTYSIASEFFTQDQFGRGSTIDKNTTFVLFADNDWYIRFVQSTIQYVYRILFCASIHFVLYDMYTILYSMYCTIRIFSIGRMLYFCIYPIHYVLFVLYRINIQNIQDILYSTFCIFGDNN